MNISTDNSRSEIVVTFHPKPEGPVAIPSPVVVRGKIIGELLSYDAKTGSGTAALDNRTSAGDLPFLELLGYTYLGMSLRPEGADERPVDQREIEAVLKLTPENLTREETIAHVLSKLNCRVDTKMLTGIVNQWWTIRNSP